MNATRAIITGHAILGLAVTAFIGTHVGAQEFEYPLAPCEHVIMMSAPDKSDGGILAYCSGAQFFVYDQQDAQWYKMTYADLRGVGDCVPVREGLAESTTRHYELIGDQRAAGVYE